MAVLADVDLTEACGDARGGARVAFGLQQLDRAQEEGASLLAVRTAPGHPPGLLEQLRLNQRADREPGSLLVVGLRFGRRSERGRAARRVGEQPAGPFADHRRVFGVRVELVRRQVVRRDHLDDLLLGASERLLEVRGCREVPGLALAPRQRLVGDLTKQVL